MRWTAVLWMTVASLPVCGQALPSPASQNHFPITTQMVAHTLSARGMQVEDRQISLLARVVATEPQPALDILTVEPLSDSSPEKHPQGRALVKLACHVAATCLPFFATVTGPAESLETAAGSSELTRLPAYTLSTPKPAITMRAGTHATLVMDDERSHIRIAVISLENGSAGRRIRVASPDHKQVYLAEVVSANLLKRSY